VPVGLGRRKYGGLRRPSPSSFNFLVIRILIAIIVPVMMLIVPMVVIIPVAFGMPTSAVGIPPAMARIPARFSRLLKFMAGVLGPLALVASMFDGFVQIVVRPGHPSLTIVGPDLRCRNKRHQSSECNACKPK
jgi:hypothetical protein